MFIYLPINLFLYPSYVNKRDTANIQLALNYKVAISYYFTTNVCLSLLYSKIHKQKIMSSLFIILSSELNTVRKA